MTPSTPAPTDTGMLADALRNIVSSAERLPEPETKPTLQIHLLRARLSDVAHLAKAAISAAQETRGDEPVAWQPALDAAIHLINRYRKVATDIQFEQVLDAENDFGIALDAISDSALAPSQQSPRLEREGVASEVRKAKVHVVEQWEGAYGYVENAESLKVADAILALLSPDTSVVPSPEREPGPMVPWELDCRRAVCAAPECECPAVSSNHPREVE